MKTLCIIALLPLAVFANPMPGPEPEAGPELAHIDKRAVTCALTGSNVKYHTKPDLSSSTAVGEFGAAGTKVSFSCWTTGPTYEGNNLWNKIASGTGKGYYVTDYYITRACSGQITTYCG